METRFLRRMSIFGGIQTGILDHLIELAQPVTVVEGEFFFQEGSRGTSAFVLEDGRVSILKSRDGTNQLLRHLETGDCFGEVALLDFGPRSASVLADVDCKAIEISAGNLLEISKIDLEQFALIYMNLARELSRRLRAADDRLFAARLEGSAFATDYAFSTT